MNKRDNIFRIKIEYEENQIIDIKTKGIKGLRRIFDEVEAKIG